MSRTAEELQSVLEKMATEAHHGDGLHYELFARRYSETVDQFKQGLTDPDEVRTLDSLLAKDGVYYRTDISDSERHAEWLKREFDKAPKTITPEAVTWREYGTKGYVWNLDVPENQTVELPAGVVEVHSLRIGRGATLIAPGVEKVTQNLIAFEGSRLSAPQLEKVGTIGSHSTIELGNGFYEPAFEAISIDGLEIPTFRIQGAKIDAPNLRRIAADLIVRGGNVHLPALERLEGALDVAGTNGSEAQVNLPSLRVLGAEVGYPHSEEETITVTTSMALNRCSLDTPTLRTFRASQREWSDAKWNYPLTYQIAQKLGRVGDLPTDEIVTHIMGLKSADNRFQAIHEVALSGPPSAVFRDVLLKMDPAVRFYGYLSCDSHNMSVEDTRTVLQSLPRETLEAVELRIPLAPGSYGEPTHISIRPAKAITEKLEQAGIDAAPPGLAEAVRASDQAAVRFISERIDHEFRYLRGNLSASEAHIEDAISNTLELLGTLSPGLVQVAHKVADANRHSGTQTEALERLFTAMSAVGKEVSSLNSLEMRFWHSEALARFMPNLATVTITDKVRRAREEYVAAIRSDKRDVLQSLTSEILGFGAAGRRENAELLREAAVKFVTTGSGWENVVEKAETHTAWLKQAQGADRCHTSEVASINGSSVKSTHDEILAKVDALWARFIDGDSTAERDALAEADKLVRGLGGSDLTGVPLRVAVKDFVQGHGDWSKVEQRLNDHLRAQSRAPHHQSLNRGRGVER